MGVHEQNEFEIDRLFLGSNGEFTDSFVSGWTRRPRAPCGCPRGNRRRNFPVRFHAGRVRRQRLDRVFGHGPRAGQVQGRPRTPKSSTVPAGSFLRPAQPSAQRCRFRRSLPPDRFRFVPVFIHRHEAEGSRSNKNFKIILRHGRVVDRDSVSYELFFDAPASDELRVVRFPLTEFNPYGRGKPQNDSEPLDASNISSIGIQFYGGVYEEAKQSGPATLEIDWIKASK